MQATISWSDNPATTSAWVDQATIALKAMPKRTCSTDTKATTRSTLLSLVVEMLERGYDAKNGEAVMLKSLRDGMRKKTVFIEPGGLWRVQAG